MFRKNKQNKLRQTKKNEIKEESYLNYATIIKMLSVSIFSKNFYQINLLNIHKKMFVLFSSSNLLLVCLLQSWHKRNVGVYKVFNSNDLTLLFYSVYLYFILDLRRDNKKHNCTYFKL